jgi:uncharacterized protein (UPF0147 family)
MTTFLMDRDTMTTHRSSQLRLRLISGIVLLTAAMFFSERSIAQGTTDSLQSVIGATRAKSREAARVFLDSARSVEERERAGMSVGAFLDSADALAALRVAGNAKETERIRVVGLTRSTRAIDGNQAAESALLGWLSDQSAPPALRSAAMTTLSALLVGSRMRASRRAEIVKVLKGLSVDADSTLRRPALAWLATSGDQETINRLIRALRPGADSLVAPAEAVVLLSASGSTDARVAMRPLLLLRGDTRARTEIIRALGGDRGSASVLDRLVGDSTEPDSIRSAAMGAVFANRPHDFPEVALPLVSDEKASDDLRVFAIEAVRLRSTAPSPELKISPSSRFDDTMRRLARESASPRVRAAAAAYVRGQRQ